MGKRPQPAMRPIGATAAPRLLSFVLCIASRGFAMSLTHRPLSSRKFVDLPLQFLELLSHFRQFRNQSEEQFLFAFGNGGTAEHGHAVANVTGHTGLCTEDGTLADVHVITDADLPGHDYVIAGCRA